MAAGITTWGRIGAAAALAAATPLVAQSGSAADEVEIVVQGQRLSVTKAIRESIRDAGVQQLARFEDPICPSVIGVPQESARALEQMVRDNAVSLGGRAAKPGCTVNAVVIFDDDPIQFVKASAKTQPAYFASMTPRQFDQFTAKPRPVVSWHVTEVRNRDGTEMGDSDKGTQAKKMFDANVTTPIVINADVNRQAAATRLYANTRQDMTVGVVVIDRRASNGKTGRQLADLATLHLLLDVRQDPPVTNPASILSLLEPQPDGALPPAELSQFDRGLVNGLYGRRANNLSASQQFSNIAKAVQRAAHTSSAE